ncbi:lineage-specific thermal regulator protein [Planctomycetes bacterium Poly30]|uniref:Lineage-specific thermal regulator protein n=1 Tax=Saltatorellus ferox TaxID=2528018 RepID=A0A518ES95_9BACT|nr:lineage-specific thermal regulator protein [Planctomycetes bacterium Poly30]
MSVFPKGALDLLVLKVLQSQSLHGYGIAARIQELSEEVLAVEEGTLYPALHRMERTGWIKSSWQPSPTGRRARFYELTGKGRKYLAAGVSEWETTNRAIGRVLGTEPA